jgi:hypothetical protein
MMTNFGRPGVVDSYLRLIDGTMQMIAEQLTGRLIVEAAIEGLERENTVNTADGHKLEEIGTGIGQQATS